MTSGIYLLTFGEDDYVYVGKSVDIESRWKQHFTKLEKGIAAKNMQAAYSLRGLPNTGILREVHPDHLDVVEPLYISAFRETYGVRCLNSSTPTIYHMPNAEDLEYLEQDDKYIKQSTLTNIRELIDYSNQIMLLKYEIEQLQNKLDNIDLGEEGNAWRLKATELEENYEKLLEEERNKSWWKKLMG